jgi:hypothetical protein
MLRPPQISATVDDWPDVELPDSCEVDPNELDTTVYESMRAAAWDWLWKATGRQFGTWHVTYTPGDPGGCGCHHGRRLHLPGPVLDVETVTIDTAPFTGYTPLPDGALIRDDGEPWPTSGVVVEYVRGVRVPDVMAVYVGILWCELLRAITGDDDCRLPSNVQTVTRGGVTITMDTSEAGAIPRTGVPEIDNWVDTINPHRVVRPAAIYSPDIDPLRNVEHAPPWRRFRGLW